MTASEVITRVDELAPNQYTVDQKLHWLSDFDGKTFNEILMTHEPCFGVMFPYDAIEDVNAELIIPPPYASDIYVNYILSRIAEANAEINKYNLYATLFNSAYDEFKAWFNRTHMPKQNERWRF